MGTEDWDLLRGWDETKRLRRGERESWCRLDGYSCLEVCTTTTADHGLGECVREATPIDETHLPDKTWMHSASYRWASSWYPTEVFKENESNN